MAKAKNPTGAFVLLTFYSNLYKDKYGAPPRINKYREKWGMSDVLDDLGRDKAEEVLRFYFLVPNQGHSLQFFYNNYDGLLESMERRKRDKEKRKQLLEETRKLVENNDQH